MAFYTTPSGIEYEELDGFPQFSGSGAAMQATAQWKFNGALLEEFLDDLYPPPIFGGFGYIPPPLQYPGKPWLYIQSFRIVPLGGDAQEATHNTIERHNTFDHLVAELTFGTMSWEVRTESGGDQNIVSIDVSFGGEYMAMKGYGFKWEATDNPIDDPEVEVGKLIPTIEYGVQIHNYPYLPLQTIISLLGKVNDADNQIIGHEKEETLLFVGASANRTITLRGAGSWQLSYRFSERQVKHDGTSGNITWNHFWCSDSRQDAAGDDITDLDIQGVPKWLRVVDDEDDPVFPKADLSALFTATI